MKKILLIVGLMFFALGTWAHQYEATVDGTTWYYDLLPNGDAKITWPTSASGVSYSGSITVPQDINGHHVTSIGSQAFEHCSSLNSITIPDGVTSIGRWAFYDCSSLTSIVISSGVTSIGDYAFEGCSSLTSITIPDSVISMGSGVFVGCNAITSFVVGENNSAFSSVDGMLCSKDGKEVVAGINGDVTIPDGMTSIGEYAFSEYASLTSITIPDSVTSIASSAFAGCCSLTSYGVGENNPTYSSINGLLCSKDGKEVVAGVNGDVTIPDGVISIGAHAFYDCKALTSITIPSSVTSIGECAFKLCSSLTSITIPKGVTSISPEVFYGCGSLASVTIPDGVTSIGESAFIFCDSLTSITIPEGLTLIDREAFYSCDSLTSITIPSSVISIGEKAFMFCDSLASITIPNGVTSIGPYAFSHCTSLASITIPNSVTSIGNYAFVNCSSLASVVIPDSVMSIWGLFSGCSSLTSVTIGGSVTTIGSDTFKGCSSLTSVTIPDSVTEIGSYAFYDCSSLTSVTIPDSVTHIWNYVFYNCSSLTSITIPDSVTWIGSDVFEGCSSLKEVHITDLAKWCAITFYISSSNPCRYAHHLYLNDEEVTELVIPEGVTSISKNAFYGCSSLKSVTIPDGVTSIGIWAFKDCSALTSIAIGGNMTLIDDNAFEGCSSLTSITIPNSVTSIGQKAFYGCSSLTSITIPNRVTSIGWGAFYGCSSLTSVTIPNSVTRIVSDVFHGCSSLISVTIPNSVTSIGSYAFDGCSSLTSVTIPDSVTAIGDNAFYKCSSLGSVTIPDSVTSIGSYAFDDCSSLTTVYVDKGDTDRIKALMRGKGVDVDSLTFVEVEAEDVTLPETADYTYDGATFAHSGWFSNTGSGNENFTTAGMAIGPGGGKVSAVIDGRHTWAGVKLPDAFTLSMYADASMITGASTSSKAVLWSTGGKSSNRVMLLTDGANVILSAAGGNSVSLPLPTPGYHLYTATFSASGIKLAIDDGQDGKIASNSGSYSAIATGFQIGSVYQGLPSGYRKGIGLAIAKMVGYNEAFSNDQIALLSEQYPVSTTATGVINYSVQGGKFYAGSITHTNGRLEIDRGTLMVPAGSTYSVPALRFGNNGSNGDADAFGLELDGTLVISGGQTTDGNGQSGVRADVVNNRGGILGGEWTGRGTYNIRGTLDASNSFVQLVFDAHAQTWNVENGGVMKVKAFEARAAQGKTQSTHVLNIKNGGRVVSTQGFTRGKLVADIEDGGVLEIANTANVNMTGSDLSGIIGDGQFKISNASGSGYTLLPTDPAKFFADTLEFAADSEFYLTSNKDFTIGSFSGKGNLNTKYNNEARTLTIKQAKDTTWSGNIVADTSNRLTALGITSENDSILTLEGRNNQTAAIELLEGGRIKVVGDGMTITSGVEGMEVKCVDGVYSLYTPVTAPLIEGDGAAEVSGDAETGFVIKPSAETTEVVITIPEGVAPEKVTIAVSPSVETVKANGATIKVVKGAADITEFLDIPAAVDGVVNLGAAEVKEEIVKEALDTEKGAEIELSSENPTLTTAETKPGLTYTLLEGATLESMGAGASKLGDGTAWTPEITVKGGKSGFYTIKVTK